MTSKRSTKPARAAAGRPPIFPLDHPRARVTTLVLLTFTGIFVALQVGSYSRTSATFDEPGSLAAGYAVLASGDYRPALEHPPLTRLWAALPLLAMSGVSFDSKALDAARPEAVAFQGPFDSGHRFLYAGNGDANGDALLYRARFMNVLLGVVLGVLVYSWVAEWLGFRAALVALGAYLKPYAAQTPSHVAATSNATTPATALADNVPRRHAIITRSTSTTGPRIAAENLLSIASTKNTASPAMFDGVRRLDVRHRK